jgi:hypothetical protein
MGKVKRHLDVKSHFQLIRVNLGQCARQVLREILRELKKELRAANLALFPRDIGHISQGVFCVRSVGEFVVVGGPYCTDPYSPYNKEKGHKFRGSFAGTNSRQVFKFFFVAGGFYCYCPYSRLCGTKFSRCCFQ